MTDLGIALNDPPKDGVTSLTFSDATSTLLASSWDCTLRIYDGSTGNLTATLQHDAPVLDAAFQNPTATAALSCGLDRAIRCFDIPSQRETACLGTHDEAVRCIEWLPQINLVASAGWDSTLRLWDPRAATAHVATLQLPGKAYSMSSAANRLVVATSGRQVDVYDVGQLTGAGGATIPEPEQRRESSLKHQTRCVRCFPDGTGYALSSIEGRVAMEFFDLKEEVQAKKYAFKCHRRVEEGQDMIYPVNSIAFNARYGTFATGGGDGTVNVWDGKQKKRLFQVTGYGTSIAALAFNADASLLAIAASYTWEKGETAAPPDAIYVRQMSDAEVVPRHLQQQQQQQATHVGNSGHVGAHAVAV